MRKWHQDGNTTVPTHFVYIGVPKIPGNRGYPSGLFIILKEYKYKWRILLRNGDSNRSFYNCTFSKDQFPSLDEAKTKALNMAEDFLRAYMTVIDALKLTPPSPPPSP